MIWFVKIVNIVLMMKSYLVISKCMIYEMRPDEVIDGGDCIEYEKKNIITLTQSNIKTKVKHISKVLHNSKKTYIIFIN